MKKAFVCILLLSGIYGIAQTVIVDEKFVKDDKPIEFQLLKKQNQLLVNKGKPYGSIRGINKAELYSIDNSPKKTIVTDGRFLEFNPSFIDDSFSGTQFNGVGWVADTKVYADNKLIATVDSKKPMLFFSKEFSFDIGNEKNKGVGFLEKEDIFLHKFVYKTGKTEIIKLIKPNFLRANKKDFYKLKDIFHMLYYHNESFEIATKFIQNNTKSFILHRAIYDYNGNILENLAYDVDINKPLIFSNNGGGNFRSVYNGFTMVQNRAFRTVNPYVDIFADQLSINNFYVDPDSGNLYIYGLYGRNEGRFVNNDVQGFYIVKFDAKGNKIWQKTEELTDEQIKKNAVKLKLNLDFDIVQGNIIFSIHNSASDPYYFYSKVNSNNGDIIKNDILLFEVDKMGVAEHAKTEVVAFYTLADYKYLKFDMNTFSVLKDNQKLQSYLSGLGGPKNKISINSFSSDKGIWLIESDNKEYYKVTYFKHE
ncbi:MAG: hypothetical protein ACK4M4_02220 [Flavobacterium sp.]